MNAVSPSANNRFNGVVFIAGRRVIEERRYLHGRLYVTRWTYDAMDRVVTITYPNLNESEVVSYTYNDQLLLATMVSSLVGSIATDITYNALDLPTRVKLSNNASQNLYLRHRYYRLDPEVAGSGPYGALWDIRLERGSPVELLLRLEHGYDPVRNIIRTIESPDWQDYTFEYDDLDRMLKRKITGGADQEWLTYSQIGNILTKNGSGYTYGSPKPHAVTNDGTNPYVYDNNGNMTQRGTGQYIKYDAENRPVKVSSDVGGAVYIARFAIDGDGRRAKRVDALGSIHYVRPHYERNVGTGADTTEIITKFYHAQMGRVSRLIAFKKGGTLYYVVPDHLGGTLRVVDTSGNTIDDLRYHAFGATRSGGTNTPTDKRFTGQTLDMSTGLYSYGARSYDSALGRFVQPDSIVPQTGNPQSLNRYSYVYNNPLKYSDPSGHGPIQNPAFNTKLAGWDGGGAGGAGGIGIVVLAYLTVRALAVTAAATQAEVANLIEGAREFASQLLQMRYIPGLSPEQEKAHNTMLKGLQNRGSPGQPPSPPPGGWNLDDVTKFIIAALSTIVGYKAVDMALQGRSLPQRQGDPFDRGEDLRNAASDGFGSQAANDWSQWIAEFRNEHGGYPTLDDISNRQWSLDFLAQTGHGPSTEDWERHYYDPSYTGQ